MNETAKIKGRVRDWLPVRLFVLAFLLIIIGASYLLQSSTGVMVWLYEHITRPWHYFMSRVCSVFPFSVAELIYAVAVVFVIVYIIFSVIRLIRRPRKGRQVYITVITIAIVPLLFWCALRVFWTPCYYAPRFAEMSGVSDEPVSVEELRDVTAYFASLCSEYRERVDTSSQDRDGIVDRASEVFTGASDAFPCLEGRSMRPKGIICSKIMSYLDFTGFFFPFTGEANLNMDSPAYLLPSTAEHEIAHQRGVAQEQDCNFVAVFACMQSEYDDYRYAGAVLAYTYLGNALYGENYDMWYEIYSTLSPAVLADFAANSEYWAQFKDSAPKKASNAVYDSFLKSNGQELGRKSYGACVDLLVNYYKDRI